MARLDGYLRPGANVISSGLNRLDGLLTPQGADTGDPSTIFAQGSDQIGFTDLGQATIVDAGLVAPPPMPFWRPPSRVRRDVLVQVKITGLVRASRWMQAELVGEVVGARSVLRVRHGVVRGAHAREVSLDGQVTHDHIRQLRQEDEELVALCTALLS